MAIDSGEPRQRIPHFGEAEALEVPDIRGLGHGGIPDNTASLGISRNPTDGILDMFVEDCVGNRFHWHRVDDRKKPEIRSVRLLLTKP